MNGKFEGFTTQAIEFLKNLKENNNKTWFEAHKNEYQKTLLEPLRDLAEDLSGDMLAIDSFLIVGAKAVSRIYRDTRFAHNKEPYKTTMWLTFKRPGQEWMGAPAYFFEIAADAYRYGMGYYSAAPDTMRRLRRAIDEKPQEFQKAVAFYTKDNPFVVEGELYKKLIDSSKPEEMQVWYQRKNLYLVCNREIGGSLFSGNLIDELVAGFNLLARFYHFLMKLRKQDR